MKLIYAPIRVVYLWYIMILIKNIDIKKIAEPKICKRRVEECVEVIEQADCLKFSKEELKNLLK